MIECRHNTLSADQNVYKVGSAGSPNVTLQSLTSGVNTICHHNTLQHMTVFPRTHSGAFPYFVNGLQTAVQQLKPSQSLC